MINKNEICRILSERIEIPNDFNIGEITNRPNSIGCVLVNGNWHLYRVDDRGGCTFTGPFVDKSIIYACALSLHKAELFEDYEFSEEDYSTYMGKHFRIDEVSSGVETNLKKYNGPTYTDILAEGSKSKVPVIIAIVIVAILLFGALRMVLAYVANRKSSQKLVEAPVVNSELPKENEFTEMIADTWEDQSEDMSGKTLTYSYDGVNPAGSYWEFIDDKQAKLVMKDGSYYDADYLIFRDELGMLYTELKFPEYGLTYEELKRVTDANMEKDENCNGYVVIVFNNMVLHNESNSDNEADDEADGSMFYYGVSYTIDDGTLYNVVGANSADYYTFIDFEK